MPDSSRDAETIEELISTDPRKTGPKPLDEIYAGEWDHARRCGASEGSLAVDGEREEWEDMLP